MTKTLTVQELLEDEKASEKIKDLPFESGLKLLEELVGKVESGTLPLEKAISSYERGVLIVSRLREQLSGAEEKLKILSKSGKAKASKSES